MATRQYIGARYVPKFAGSWNINTAYEPLTIVQDVNGNSYTSKVKVPAGIQLNNTAYWYQSSVFNAQVEALRTEVATLNNDLAEVETIATDAQQGAADAALAVTRLRSLVNVPTILIGDSYAAGTGADDGIGWAEYFETITECNLVAHAYQNGGGFAAPGNSNADYPNLTYANVLTSMNSTLSTDVKNSVALIIMQSGYNDCAAGRNPDGQAGVVSGVTAALNRAHSFFPNALVVVVPTWNDLPIETGTQYNILYNIIGNACQYNKCLCTDASIAWFYGRSNLMAGDNTHYNASGYRLLARYIYALVCGWNGVTNTSSLAATNAEGTTGTLFCIRRGNMVIIRGNVTVATLTLGTAFVNIPEQMRPRFSLYLPVMVYGAAGNRCIAMAQFARSGDVDIRDLGYGLTSYTNIPIYINLEYQIDLPR